MIIKYRSNLVAGIASIVFGVAVWILVPLQIGREFGDAEGITSRSVPYGLAVVCVLAGLALGFQSLVLKKDTVKSIRVGQELRGVAYMLTFIVYGVMFNHSFIGATVFLGCATLAFSGTRKILYYAIIIASAAAMYLLITQLLHVRLP